MSQPARTTIMLDEYHPRELAREALDPAIGELIWRQYNKQVEVTFPSPITGNRWRLMAQGYVGYIPITPTLGLSLRPKVPIRSIFRMLEYAYGGKTFQFLDDLYATQSLDELYERLAETLARRVLRRCRNGLVRAYIAETEELNVVRGSLNVRRMAQRPWDTRLECTYHEHTANIDDNQILAWTLFVIGRSGICRPEHALPIVHQAFRQLQGGVHLVPVPAEACVGRRYHRLNADYAPLHALCHFFLANSGPHYAVGERAMIPFLVDTARLYEQFVSAWMREQLPPSISIHAQERYAIGNSGALSFAIDIVLKDMASGVARCVLDTKYKRVSAPSTDDIAQVVAYATAQGCHDAILAYPYAPVRPLDTWIGDVRVRTAVFSLEDDLAQAGQTFLQQILMESTQSVTRHIP